MCIYVSVSLQSEQIFSSYNVSCMERKVVGKTETYDKKLCMFHTHRFLNCTLTITLLSI